LAIQRPKIALREGDRDRTAACGHDGCGGRAGKAELLTGIEGVSSRPMRKIVLLER
jgi:hypothetical protein